ncbi:MAG: hypothetical protein Q9211_003016 [Gyalolechia sp. 1 TL-2023]
MRASSDLRAYDKYRSFYTLSKKHHPDRNPDDKHAAERFVKVTEAYAILGNPPKREEYDRETQRTATEHWRNAPKGSYSSSAPHGSRPASGLSKRRTQFRGPPPSFYRNGGWGQHRVKRQQPADATASAHADAASRSGSAGATRGGFGPAGSPEGFDYDVPHFDRDGHMRRQEQQDHRRGRRVGEETVDYSNGGSMLLNFLIVSGILAVTVFIPTVFVRRRQSHRKNDDI